MALQKKKKMIDAESQKKRKEIYNIRKKKKRKGEHPDVKKGCERRKIF